MNQSKRTVVLSGVSEDAARQVAGALWRLYDQYNFRPEPESASKWRVIAFQKVDGNDQPLLGSATVTPSMVFALRQYSAGYYDAIKVYLNV